MAGSIWGENVAVQCVRFWLRTKYPDRDILVQIHRSEHTLNFITLLKFIANDGKPMVVTFSTDSFDFTSERYKIPNETKTQLMLLLG